MTEARSARPRMLISACLYLGMVFAIVGIQVITVLIGWNSIEGQAAVRRQTKVFVEDGMSQADASSAYRILLTIVAIVAASGIVLAIYTSKGHRASRIIVSVLAGLVAVVGLIGAASGAVMFIFVGIIAMVCIYQLWSPDVRAWFADPTSVPDPHKPGEGKGGSKSSAAVTPAVTPASYVDQSVAPAGTQDDVLRDPWGDPIPVPTATGPMGARPAVSGPAGARPPMPKTVSIAVWTALVGSIVVGGACALALLAFAIVGGDYEQVMRDGGFGTQLIRDSGMEVKTLYTISIVMSAVFAVLSAAGLIASIAALKGRSIGRVALLVMSSVTVIASILAFPVGIPWTVAGIITIIQLRKPESTAWFVRT